MDLKDQLNIGYKLVDGEGNPIDPDGVFFILKLNSEHEGHAKASRRASRAYAECIKDELPFLADRLNGMCDNIEGK